jgi:fumarate hydratase class II
MNANEVISNRAIEMLGGEMRLEEAGPPQRPRQHGPVVATTPIPTAMHIACAERDRPRPDAGADASCTTPSNAKAQAWRDIVKIGRTHLQDATPLTLGQEFSGYAAQVAHGHRAHRADAAEPSASWRRAAPRSAPA